MLNILLLFFAMWMTIASEAFAQESVQLYTWFSATRGDHFTTSDPGWVGRQGEVRLHGEGSGYVLVRIEGNVFNPARPQPPGTVPLYNFWHPGRADNFLTSDPNWVRTMGLQGYGRFRLEGYIYSTPRPGTLPLRSFWSPSREDNYATTDPRLAVPINGSAGELTVSVEGGRYGHYRVEGFMPPPPGPNPAPRPAPLNGLVDMHAHPMSHLGFGKKLIHGVPDAAPDGTVGVSDGVPDGSIIPAGTRDCNERDTRARSIEQALAHDNSTHGGHDLFHNTCGNHIRNEIIKQFERLNGANQEHGADKEGWPRFLHWPKHNDITHQQMWVDWIRRAHQNGMRVMVALAVNNSTLANALSGDPPFDDRGSADLQIREIRAFVNRHRDFMELALTSADLRRIVNSGRLAVVIGIEVDNIGNFSSAPAESVTREAIGAEIARLRELGVRYVFPIHLTNNRFGGAAAYKDFFNAANRLQEGGWYDLECSPTVGWRHGSEITSVLNMLSLDRPAVPNCPPGQGHRNRLGLTPAGREAMDILMRSGMLIDIDHMSERATDETLALGRDFPSGWGYPLVSGHNGLRGTGGEERHLRADQLEALRDRGGMLGLGWSHADAAQFRENFGRVREILGDGRVAFGTDMNGAEHQPGPRAGTRVATTWRTGLRVWDYSVDGVANYGMIPEFVQDLQNIDSDAGSSRVGVNTLFGAAEGFARVWERAELSARSVVSLPVSLGPNVRILPPRATDFLCPSQVVAGDREFDGHGPEIWVNAELQVRPDQVLEAVLTMRARETQHDWSETRGTWRIPLSPPGMRVQEVLSSRQSGTHVISSAAGFQIGGPGSIPNAVSKPPISGELVREFQIVGDTGGDDISTDSNCNDDTRMRVVFNPIRVRVAP